MRCVMAAVAALLAIPTASIATTSSATPAQQSTKSTAAKNDYSKPDNWLCRPARHDACDVDLSTTVISADGKLTREAWVANRRAPIDCFYVYPTVSTEPTGNSDMVQQREEKNVVRAQFARFGSQCRMYAPMYRQVTLAALRANMAGAPIAVDRPLAYNDVRDA